MMNINPVILSIPIYFLLIGVELLIQAFSKKHIYRLNDALTNISCGITQQITGAFFKVFTIAAYQFAYENWAFFDIPVTWWSIVLLILGVDFCYYWAHRMSHEVNLFWGGHVVHHQSEDYNFSVALRQGSFQVLWTFWFYMPLAFIGFDTITFLLISALNTVYQFWIHTETIGKLPKLVELIFNTPSHHRVHHGRNPKYIDKNHAGSLIIWDRLFGTFQEEDERPTYGITQPINTWNPVWANIAHYSSMFRQMAHTPGIMNKWRILWHKPGWRPADHGGHEAPKEIDQAGYAKYNQETSRKMNTYVLSQFVVILGITSVFLFLQEKFTLTEKLAFSSVIIWSVAEFGLLLDNNSQWVKIEYLRIIFAAIFIASLVNYIWVYILGASYIMITSGWFYWASKPIGENKSLSKI